jgi:hypothetical protein
MGLGCSLYLSNVDRSLRLRLLPGNSSYRSLLDETLLAGIKNDLDCDSSVEQVVVYNVYELLSIRRAVSIDENNKVVVFLSIEFECRALEAPRTTWGAVLFWFQALQS